MAQTKSLKGADIKVYVNGKLYPVVVSIRWAASSGRQAIACIDRSTPVELASGGTSIKGTLEILRLRNSGGIQGSGIAAPEDKVLLERYWSLTVIDRLSDSVILQIDEASVVDENWSVGRGLISGSFSFEGISWTNDSSA